MPTDRQAWLAGWRAASWPLRVLFVLALLLVVAVLFATPSNAETPSDTPTVDVRIVGVSGPALSLVTVIAGLGLATSAWTAVVVMRR